MDVIPELNSNDSDDENENRSSLYESDTSLNVEDTSHKNYGQDKTYGSKKGQVAAVTWKLEDMELKDTLDTLSGSEDDYKETDVELQAIAERSRGSTTPNNKELFHEKPDLAVAAQHILVQPEFHFLQQEMEEKKKRAFRPRSLSTTSELCEEEMALIRRFPWLAEKLKLAWAEVKDTNPQQSNSKATESTAMYNHSSILKQRTKSSDKVSLKTDEHDEKEARPKVVFSRNIPLFVYSNKTKKAIRVGGETSKSMNEEVYKTLEYNPELKKITLDLQDLRNPDKDKTVHLAMSYISSTTHYNPLVISEHMARYSGKKEASIQYLVKEVEKRLLVQREQREERNNRWKMQLVELIKAKLEAELKQNDIMVAKRQLEESMKHDASVFTEYERQQERRRRIKLRSKAIPVYERIKKTEKKRRYGHHNSSLHRNLFAPPKDGL